MEKAKKYWWVILLVILILIGIYLYMKNKQPLQNKQPPKPPVTNDTLSIVSARYGCTGCNSFATPYNATGGVNTPYNNSIDVAGILSGQIINNGISIKRDLSGQFMNVLFGQDPCPNCKKTLTVQYKLGVQSYVYVITDDQDIIINK